MRRRLFARSEKATDSRRIEKKGYKPVPDNWKRPQMPPAPFRRPGQTQQPQRTGTDRPNDQPQLAHRLRPLTAITELAQNYAEVTGGKLKRRIREIVTELNEQRKRLSDLRKQVTGLATKLRNVASCLGALVKGSPQPRTQRDVLTCPTAEDVIAVHTGIETERLDIAALVKRLKDLDIDLS